MDRVYRLQIPTLMRLIDDMRSEVEQALGGRGPMAPAGRWAPEVDVHETADALVLVVELPGVKQEDIQVQVTGEELTIAGERRYVEPEGGRVLQVERRFGPFQRSFPLPLSVQRDGIKASLREGVLTLRLPKAEAVKPRAIQVHIED